MTFRKPAGEAKWEDEYRYVTYPKKLVPDVTDLLEKENQGVLKSASAKKEITLEEVQNILDEDV